MPSLYLMSLINCVHWVFLFLLLIHTTLCGIFNDHSDYLHSIQGSFSACEFYVFLFVFDRSFSFTWEFDDLYTGWTFTFYNLNGNLLAISQCVNLSLGQMRKKNRAYPGLKSNQKNNISEQKKIRYKIKQMIKSVLSNLRFEDRTW